MSRPTFAQMFRLQFALRFQYAAHNPRSPFHRDTRAVAAMDMTRRRMVDPHTAMTYPEGYRPYKSSHGAAGAVVKNGNDSMRWTETYRTALRRMGDAHTVAPSRVDHKGWYKQDEADSARVYRGVVFHLPHGRFLAGYEDSEGQEGMACIEQRVYDDSTEAAQAGDEAARIAAEREREYNRAWQAGNQWQTKRAELRNALAERRDAKLSLAYLNRHAEESELTSEHKRLMRYDQHTMESYGRGAEELISEMATLANGDDSTFGFWNGNPDLREAFNEGAGRRVL